MTSSRYSLLGAGGLAFFLSGSILLSAAHGGTSASYTLAPATLDRGGLRGTSANYTANFSANAGGAGSSATYTLRSGYAGQLSDAIATAIDITASPLTVNEGGTRQLSATLIFDDLTAAPLAANSITWSIQSGPIAGISADGLAAAAMVYENTAAVVHGSYQTFTDTLHLTVININNDDLPGYAGDGLDDAWQAQYFGLNNPNAAPQRDPDGDGQSNLFEFAAGISPINGASRFVITASPVPGQPSQKNIIISPRFADRTYTVLSNTTLIPANWSPLSSATISDNGQQRTFTDTSATGARKFYRVQIARP